MTPLIQNPARSLLLLATLAFNLPHADADETIPEVTLTDETVSADFILDRVVKALPQESVSFSGRLRSYEKSAQPQHKARSGLRSSTYQIAVTLNWGQTPPNASYDISDKNKGLLESMSLKRMPDGQTPATYTRGPQRTPAETPALNARIQSTNLSWSDLSLSFLWWRGGKIIGQERFHQADETEKQEDE